MMTEQYIVSIIDRSHYVAHTSSAFHNSVLNPCFAIPDTKERNRAVREQIDTLVSDCKYSLLPFRIYLLRGDTMSDVNKVGRASLPMSAQLKGEYTTKEESIYKRYKPYKVQTGLWPVENYDGYYAGSIGITGPSGQIDRDNSDLIVIYTLDWVSVEVSIFRGLAGTYKSLDCLPDVMNYLLQEKRKGYVSQHTPVNNLTSASNNDRFH